VLELNRRLGADSRVRAYAADPGLVNTEIGLKGMVGLARLVWDWYRSRGASPAQGAETIVHLAAAPRIDATRGAYWKACRPVTPGRRALQPEAGQRLWELSCRLCGIAWESYRPFTGDDHGVRLS
jgi:hypothetical protein